jgi:hypothetical protein
VPGRAASGFACSTPADEIGGRTSVVVAAVIQLLLVVAGSTLPTLP